MKQIIFWALLAFALSFICLGCGESPVSTGNIDIRWNYRQYLKVEQISVSGVGDTLKSIIFDESINTNFLDSTQQRILNTNFEILYVGESVFTTVEFRYKQQFDWLGVDTYVSYWVINNSYVTLNNEHYREGVINLNCDESYIVENFVTLAN